MIRQQYAKAISGPLVPAFLFFLVILYHRIAKKWFKLTEDDKLLDFSDDAKCGRSVFISVLPIIMCGIFGIWLINSISYSIQIMINPEYYALKDLLSMILGKQGM